MTTWQDKQPTSRRALRESERKHAQAVLSEEPEVEAEEERSDQQIWNSPPGPEPLNYATRGREQDNQIEPGSRRAVQSPPVQQVTDAGHYRLRDFSPESRGGAFTATQPTQAMPWTRAATGGGDLDYHTATGIDRAEQAPEDPASELPPNLGTPEPLSPPSSDGEHGIPVDVTMTRRELRALREAAESQSRVPIAPVEPVEPTTEPEAVTPPEAFSDAVSANLFAASFDLVQPDVHQPLPPVAPKAENSAELTEALAEFDALYRGRIAQPSPAKSETWIAPATIEPVEVEPVEVVAVDEHLIEELPVADVAAVSGRTAWAATPPPPSVSDRVSVASESASWPGPPDSTVAEPPSVEERTDGPTPSAQDREIVIAPEMSNRPIGHWSTQAGIDDRHQAGDHTMSRNLAAIDAITTNALVLPNFPSSVPLTGPVGNTGEILITGSIDLPRSLGRSGLHPGRYDHADVDMLDRSDREDAAPDSAPVRAIRAVSTHTSSQGLIATKRPTGNNLPVILSITAGVMMVGVVVLVVAGMVFKIF